MEAGEDHLKSLMEKNVETRREEGKALNPYSEREKCILCIGRNIEMRSVCFA